MGRKAGKLALQFGPRNGCKEISVSFQQTRQQYVWNLHLNSLSVRPTTCSSHLFRHQHSRHSLRLEHVSSPVPIHQMQNLQDLQLPSVVITLFPLENKLCLVNQMFMIFILDPCGAYVYPHLCVFISFAVSKSGSASDNNKG